MRKMMIAGGTIGFGTGVLSGLATNGTTWPAILFRASVGAFAFGLLLRWWAKVWTACCQQAQVDHETAHEKSQAAPLAAPTK